MNLSRMVYNMSCRVTSVSLSQGFKAALFYSYLRTSRPQPQPLTGL